MSIRRLLVRLNDGATFESSADDVAALLRYLKVQTADIFGFSNGASIALQVAIRHPQRRLIEEFLDGTAGEVGGSH
jgi:pimeloyl-ACP methyl ester carboxylesterase